jgi:hypothetical protein
VGEGRGCHTKTQLHRICHAQEQEKGFSYSTSPAELMALNTYMKSDGGNKVCRQAVRLAIQSVLLYREQP